MEAHDKIFEIVVDKDEVTWQTIMYDLVRTEQMDPWDVDVGLLSKKFVKKIHELKEMDFRLSGKIVLAAAILLKIKSTRLVGADLEYLDSLMSSKEVDEDMLFEEPIVRSDNLAEKPPLIPRTPQPRKRKVSIFDLVKALDKALEVKKRRVLQSIPPRKFDIPIKHKDITSLIRTTYGKIKTYFLTHVGQKLTFFKLLPSETREDKIFTFIPLLHLCNSQKITLDQKEAFGDIDIGVRKKGEVEKETAEMES